MELPKDEITLNIAFIFIFFIIFSSIFFIIYYAKKLLFDKREKVLPEANYTEQTLVKKNYIKEILIYLALGPIYNIAFSVLYFWLILIITNMVCIKEELCSVFIFFPGSIGYLLFVIPFILFTSNLFLKEVLKMKNRKKDRIILVVLSLILSLIFVMLLGYLEEVLVLPFSFLSIWF